MAGLYYAADRLYNMPQVNELLETGSVILDRYVDSNMAHQGSNGKTKEEREQIYKFFEDLEYGMLGLPKPDIKVLLYMPTEFSKLLKAGREEVPDEIESDEEHLKRAERAYLEIADRNNYRIINCVKDGVIRTIEDIQEELLEYIMEQLQ